MLQNKVAVITGGASGLGFEAAKRFLKEGAIVIIADMNETKNDTAVNELGSKEGKISAFQLDITKQDQVKSFIESVISKWSRIDILLHCAGIGRGKHQWSENKWRPMEELEESDWDIIVGTNLKGTFLMNQAVGLEMIRLKSGSIVNVASLSGVVANRGLLGHGAYCASKAGVIALTKVLATEWAFHGIRVNAISPGYMDTGLLNRTKSIPGLYDIQLEMTPLGRYGKPEEFASVACFLSSDDASYITGHNLLVDGGYTAW